jgi:hypothetical protein
VGDAAEYHEGWPRWIAANLLRGVPVDALVDHMVGAGFDAVFAKSEVVAIEDSPGVWAAQQSLAHFEKRQMLLAVLGELQRQSGACNQIPRLELTADRFYNDYFYANRPVVLTGLMEGWPALRRWSPSWFAERFGDELVEVTDGRDSDQRFEDNFDQHRRELTLRDFISRITSQDGNDTYLVAKNFLLDRPGFASLYDDFQSPPGLLDPAAMRDGNVKLWLGPAGTLTPLHHDQGNILFGQVLGQKHVKLISPFSIDKLYNTRSCFSPVDLEDIDFEAFPLMKGVEVLDVVLSPGEFLLLPVGWWHWVKSLDLSISLGFQNFFYRGQRIIWHPPQVPELL